MLQILLIVDDHHAAARLCSTLNRLEIPVHTVVSDGEDALDLLQMNARFSEALRPDLVVLDLCVRGVSADILEELDAHGSLGEIPVVLLTHAQSSVRSPLRPPLRFSAHHHMSIDGDRFDSDERLLESISHLVGRNDSQMNPPAA